MHPGLEIRNGHLLDGDGNATARVRDVTAWLSGFRSVRTRIEGASGDDGPVGHGTDDRLWGDAENDALPGGCLDHVHPPHDRAGP